MRRSRVRVPPGRLESAECSVLSAESWRIAMVAFDERHEFEQYFFAGPTLGELCGLLERFARPVILCAPRLGEAMEQRGHVVPTLDLDERFAHLRGFVRWNIRRPHPLAFKPDLIICDPPFFGVSLSELF